MPQQDYDYVDFMHYNGESDKFELACRVYLTDGKLFYEGKYADEVKRDVNESDILEPFRRLSNPYSLLRAMSLAFHGTYFYATEVKEPYVDLVPKNNEDSETPAAP